MFVETASLWNSKPLSIWASESPRRVPRSANNFLDLFDVSFIFLICSSIPFPKTFLIKIQALVKFYRFLIAGWFTSYLRFLRGGIRGASGGVLKWFGGSLALISTGHVKEKLYNITFILFFIFFFTEAVITRKHGVESDRYQDMRKWILPVSRSCLNPPGTWETPRDPKF